MEQQGKTDDKLASTVKKLLAVLLYVIVFFFLAPTIVWVIYCFERLLVPAPEPVVIWLKWFLVGSGLFILCFQLAVVLLLGRFVPLRAMGVPFGTFIFWTCWSLPLLSIGIAAAFTIAAICGVEVAAVHGDGWDWD